jgi:hypothetical protein
MAIAGPPGTVDAIGRVPATTMPIGADIAHGHVWPGKRYVVFSAPPSPSPKQQQSYFPTSKTTINLPKCRIRDVAAMSNHALPHIVLP